MLKKEMSVPVIFFLVLGRTNNVLPDSQLGFIHRRIILFKYCLLFLFELAIHCYYPFNTSLVAQFEATFIISGVQETLSKLGIEKFDFSIHTVFYN
jgi:hypothetical protein